MDIKLHMKETVRRLVVQEKETLVSLAESLESGARVLREFVSSDSVDYPYHPKAFLSRAEDIYEVLKRIEQLKEESRRIDSAFMYLDHMTEQAEKDKKVSAMLAGVITHESIEE